jgi:hypothetical protein
MKTVLQIDEELAQRAKQYARKNGKTFKQVVEEALRKEFPGESISGRRRRRFKWLVVTGTKPPAIALIDRASIYDFLGKES